MDADSQQKAVGEAAQAFVEHFYDALGRRQNLERFYASTSARLTGAGVKPDISVNGAVCATVGELEALLEAQGGPVHYDVQSYDVHVVNPNYNLAAPDNLGPRALKDGSKISFAVQVSGTAKYGKGEEAVEKGFNDAFVLIPHWEAGYKNASRGMRRWVIVSQNFRAL